MQNYHPSKNLLKERNILVTGAGSGIGQAAAKAFAEYGATVILLGRNEGRLEQTYDVIEQIGGPTPAMISFDLEKAPAKDYYALGESLYEEFGVLHGFCTMLHNLLYLAVSMTTTMKHGRKSFRSISQHPSYSLKPACLCCAKQKMHPFFSPLMSVAERERPTGEPMGYLNSVSKV